MCVVEGQSIYDFVHIYITYSYYSLSLCPSLNEGKYGKIVLMLPPLRQSCFSNELHSFANATIRLNSSQCAVITYQLLINAEFLLLLG